MLLKNKKEPFLEPIFRQLRFGIALKDIKRTIDKNSIILDYGCGPEALFYKYLKEKKIEFKKYIGLDPLVNVASRKDCFFIDNITEVGKEKINVITMFAVLEHLPYGKFDFVPIINCLKKDGYLLLTTPTKMAKPILEFLSYRLGIVSRREIEEHKHYFNMSEISKLFKKNNLKVDVQKVFEMGMNNYVLFKK